MKKLIITVLIIVISVYGYSQTKNFIDQPYLETTAKVDTLVTPDRIYLSILITEKDTKGKISVEELENRMAEKLKSIGIDPDKQLTLSDLSSNFKKYFLKQQDVLKSKAYSLVVYDALTAGKVIAGLEEINISNVELEKTEYSKIEELKLNLKSKAVEKAKAQAEAMVVPLKQKLGAAIYISDDNTQVINMLRGKVSGVQIRYNSKDKNEFNPLAIEFEKIDVVGEVTVRFKIE